MLQNESYKKSMTTRAYQASHIEQKYKCPWTHEGFGYKYNAHSMVNACKPFAQNN